MTTDVSRTRRLLAPSLAVLLALGAAACGDDDDGEQGSATTSAPSTPGTGETATGDPVRVVVITNEAPSQGVRLANVHLGIDAGVAAINADGGLGGSGRPIEAEFCATEFDSNRIVECARDAVEDPDVIAVVSATGGFGDLIDPILEEGGLPNVGPLAVTPADMTSPIAFPVMGGFAAIGCTVSVLADEADASAIGVLYPNIPGGEGVLELAGQLAEGRGGSVAGNAAVNVDAADVLPEATAAASGADGVLLLTPGSVTQQLIRALRQIDPDVAVSITGADSTSPAELASIGSAAEGVLVAAFFATDDMAGEGIEAYLEAVEAAGDPDEANDGTKNAWVGLQLLDFATQGLETIDRAAVLEGLNAVSAFDSGGLAPVMDFTEPGPIEFLPRIVNPNCVYGRVDDGHVVAIDGEFVNPFQPAP